MSYNTYPQRDPARYPAQSGQWTHSAPQGQPPQGYVYSPQHGYQYPYQPYPPQQHPPQPYPSQPSPSHSTTPYQGGTHSGQPQSAVSAPVALSTSKQPSGVLRRFQIVHRPLGQGDIQDTAARALGGRGKDQLTSPALRSHWALRVENAPYGGKEGDLSTWSYFGLQAPKKFGPLFASGSINKNVLKVELDVGEKFQSMDALEQRIQGWTDETLQDIQVKAQNLIDNWGEYNVVNHNCQNFAIALLENISSEVEQKEKVAEILKKGIPVLGTAKGKERSGGRDPFFVSQKVVTDRSGNEMGAFTDYTTRADEQENLEKDINDQLYFTSGRY